MISSLSSSAISTGQSPFPQNQQLMLFCRDGALAALTRRSCTNDSHHPYRQRSNICHELAHCFLGHECTPPLTPEGERARDGSVEAEANYLAGTLLLTNEGAWHVMCRQLVAEAQHLYGISGAMLNYRLR